MKEIKRYCTPLLLLTLSSYAFSEPFVCPEEKDIRLNIEKNRFEADLMPGMIENWKKLVSTSLNEIGKAASIDAINAGNRDLKFSHTKYTTMNYSSFECVYSFENSHIDITLSPEDSGAANHYSYPIAPVTSSLQGINDNIYDTCVKDVDSETDVANSCDPITSIESNWLRPNNGEFTDGYSGICSQSRIACQMYIPKVSIRFNTLGPIITCMNHTGVRLSGLLSSSGDGVEITSEGKRTYQHYFLPSKREVRPTESPRLAVINQAGEHNNHEELEFPISWPDEQWLSVLIAKFPEWIPPAPPSKCTGENIQESMHSNDHSMLVIQTELDQENENTCEPDATLKWGCDLYHVQSVKSSATSEPEPINPDI